MTYTNYEFKVPQEKSTRVIVNTDAKNEADDQFAIVQALLSPKFDIRGVIAAHFGTRRTQRSTEESYEELELICDLMKFEKNGLIYRGAHKALERAGEPVVSEGAELIIREAMSDDPRPLYVLFFGAITDLACAYLMEPRIANRLTAVWIGGGKYPTGGPEFNLGNDVTAANIVMRSTIPLWQVPKNMYELMAVSLAELEVRVRPHGEIGRYLFDQLMAHAWEDAPRKSAFRTGECWVLGDSPAVGLLLFEHRYYFDWVPAPDISKDMTYIHNGMNRPIRVYNYIDSRFILEDLYAKLQLFAERNK